MDWPLETRNFRTQSWFLQGSTPAVRGLDGRSQFISIENRTWTNQVTVTNLREERPQILRSFVHAINGPATVFRFPVCNPYTSRVLATEEETLLALGITAAEAAAGQLPHDDGTLFDDDTGYYIDPILEPTAAADAFEGDTTLEVTGYLGLLIGVGTFFSINDFLYEVEENAGGTLRFHPTLRENVSRETVVNISDTWVKVRFADDAQARVFVDGWRFGGPVTFDIIEAFER